MSKVWVCFEVTGQEALLTDLAMVALPTVAADALVHTDFVDAGASIAAWITLTVIDVWNVKKNTTKHELRRNNF